MPQQMGLMHFWQHGDLVTHATAIALLILSAASWYVIVGKVIAQLRHRATRQRAMTAFWEAESLPLALEQMRQHDRSGAFASVALSATHAAQALEKQAPKGIGGNIDAGDFLSRVLRQGILNSQARLEHGLTFLASVGATAPFIGLFGTVWGIYHALVGLTGASQVVLDKVAGPVGEALIMTAGGLFVAIPAVLAYNACVRGNRLVIASLDGFAHDLHAYLTTGIRLQIGSNLVDLDSARRARTA